MQIIIKNSRKIMAKKLANIHPGEVLKYEFLEPMGVTPYRLAKTIKVPSIRVTAIVNEKRGISPDTALRFAAFFNNSPDFWLGLQSDYDLEESRANIAALLAQIAKDSAALRMN
jgi:addiction module HigA family antidote